MKKTIVSAGQEILDSHILNVQDNVENAIQLVLKNFMESTDGVINGFELVQGVSEVIDIVNGQVEIPFPDGSILLDGKYSTHKLDDGDRAYLNVPQTGTIVYMISVGSKLRQIDNRVLYRLVDVETRVDEQVIVPTATESVVEFFVTTGGYNSVPTGKIPLYEITVSSTGEVSALDYRKFSEIVRFRKGLQLGFKGLFYGSM